MSTEPAALILFSRVFYSLGASWVKAASPVLCLGTFKRAAIEDPRGSWRAMKQQRISDVRVCLTIKGFVDK